MNCESCRTMLSEFLDADIPPDDMRAVQEHLASCEPCSNELAMLKTLAGAVKKLPRETPSLDKALEISEMIHALSPTTRRTAFGPVLDAEELADYLHVDVTTIEVYLDELPYFELGGKLLFRKKSIEQWIEKREAQTRAQAVQATLTQGPDLQDILEGEMKWTL